MADCVWGNEKVLWDSWRERKGQHQCLPTMAANAYHPSQHGWPGLATGSLLLDYHQQIPRQRWAEGGIWIHFLRCFYPIPHHSLGESTVDKELPLLWMKAMLTLLSKKWDPHDLRNQCPVSLLCTDYKIIAKAISLWLKSMIHPN